MARPVLFATKGDKSIEGVFRLARALKLLLFANDLLELMEAYRALLGR